MLRNSIFLWGFFLFFSCNEGDNIAAPPMVEDNDLLPTNCDRLATVNANLFNQVPSSSVTVESYTLEGDCLTIRYSDSGCGGDSWEPALYDSSLILESAPIQRSIRFDLVNTEECLAYITKETSFDLSYLKEGYFRFG